MFNIKDGVLASVAAIAAGFAAIAGGLPPLVVMSAVYLAATMTLITLVDLRRLLIPDIASLPAIPLGLIAASLAQGVDTFSVPTENWLGAVAGPAFLYAVNFFYRKVRRRDGLGMGDVKLIAATGAWAGASLLPYVLLLACFAALIAVALLYWRKRGTQAIGLTTPIPFGAFLAPATFVVWMAAQWSIAEGWNPSF
ncbi:A24 family peptidase [Parvibaculum sp.]|uniref:prepilin peptidase n=1 Tax=Parvibaculum sp. TaxID=2024848 RepID=UPI003210108E